MWVLWIQVNSFFLCHVHSYNVHKYNEAVIAANEVVFSPKQCLCNMYKKNHMCVMRYVQFNSRIACRLKLSLSLFRLFSRQNSLLGDWGPWWSCTAGCIDPLWMPALALWCNSVVFSLMPALTGITDALARSGTHWCEPGENLNNWVSPSYSQ